MAIPFVMYDQETIRLYKNPRTATATFEMDAEQARELLVMLAESIVGIEGGTERLAVLFDAILERYRGPRA